MRPLYSHAFLRALSSTLAALAAYTAAVAASFASLALAFELLFLIGFLQHCERGIFLDLMAVGNFLGVILLHFVVAAVVVGAVRDPNVDRVRKR